MKNSFGNYVVQKALEVSSVFNKIKLVETILLNIEKLNEKKLINKWKKIVNNSLGKSTKNQQFLKKINSKFERITNNINNNTPKNNFENNIIQNINPTQNLNNQNFNYIYNDNIITNNNIPNQTNNHILIQNSLPTNPSNYYNANNGNYYKNIYPQQQVYNKNPNEMNMVEVDCPNNYRTPNNQINNFNHMINNNFNNNGYPCNYYKNYNQIPYICNNEMYLNLNDGKNICNQPMTNGYNYINNVSQMNNNLSFNHNI